MTTTTLFLATPLLKQQTLSKTPTPNKTKPLKAFITITTAQL